MAEFYNWLTTWNYAKTIILIIITLIFITISIILLKIVISYGVFSELLKYFSTFFMWIRSNFLAALLFVRNTKICRRKEEVDVLEINGAKLDEILSNEPNIDVLVLETGDVIEATMSINSKRTNSIKSNSS